MARRRASLAIAFLAAACYIRRAAFVPPHGAAGSCRDAAIAGRRRLLGGGGLASIGLLGADSAEAFALKAEEKQVVDIFERSSLGVVRIKSAQTTTQRRGEELLVQVAERQGTGWIFDTEGHVATNLHVLGDAAAKVTVGFADGSEAAASVVGVDGGSDIAVVKVVDMPQMATAMCKPLRRGCSGDLKVGQDVYAIGFPFNTDQQSLTRGIISGLGRTVPSAVDGRPIQGVIQTDAGLNPGNSGGPLLNSDGEVIGMNTEILSPTGASVGIGYSVPSDTIKARVASILRFGYVKRPTLGLLFGPDVMAKAVAGVPGSIVAGFQRNSQAEAAGMMAGDIILEVDGKRVQSVNDVYAMQDSREPGDTVAVSVKRPSMTESQKLKYESKKFSVMLIEADPGPRESIQGATGGGAVA